jgi:hypothetical protein
MATINWKHPLKLSLPTLFLPNSGNGIERYHIFGHIPLIVDYGIF